MVSLDKAKRSLRNNYPWVYQKVLRFYQITPYAKYKKDKRTQLENDLLKKLHARQKYEARMIRDYLNDDWTVRHGPFSGMRLAPVPPPTLINSSADAFLATMVIGSYESPLHNWINDAIAYGYDRILNLGCGEGYYAVGFALKSRDSTVYAYDIDQRARENTAALAHLNGIEEKVHVRGLCTFDELNRELRARALIFCDIEGGEFDLLRPDLVPALSGADLIVEMHGLAATLVRRFPRSHRAEIVYHGAKHAAEFPVLSAIPATEHALLLHEGRSSTQHWVRLLANQPGDIEPGAAHEWWPRD